MSPRLEEEKEWTRFESKLCRRCTYRGICCVLKDLTELLAHNTMRNENLLENDVFLIQSSFSRR